MTEPQPILEGGASSNLHISPSAGIGYSAERRSVTGLACSDRGKPAASRRSGRSVWNIQANAARFAFPAPRYFVGE